MILDTSLRILGAVEKLDAATEQAIWLQTDEGSSWDDEKGGDVSYWDEEVARYIFNDFVMKSAADWTNARIEKFKEREFD